MFANLMNPATWLRKRDESMASARACRATLTDPNSFWCYPSNDDRVKAAVTHWIDRARHCHDMALGRTPVISDMMVIEESGTYSGPVYADRNYEKIHAKGVNQPGGWVFMKQFGGNV